MRRRNLLAAAIATAISPTARAAARPVVLELFTSQGCSSCPPADALLGTLAKRPEVIALAWHVDYWDHLGWRDRYASREATDRQKAFAGQLGSEVFTPALVVDGARVVVGSDRKAVETAIAAAAALPVTVNLIHTQDGMSVEIAAASIPLRALRIVYDPVQATDVAAGENEGERLHEYRIVREVETLGLCDGGACRFSVKPPAAGQGIVILLEAADLRIMGAADQPPA